MAKGFDRVRLSQEDIRQIRPAAVAAEADVERAEAAQTSEGVARAFLEALAVSDGRPSLQTDYLDMTSASAEVPAGVAADLVVDAVVSNSGPQLNKSHERTEQLTGHEMVSFEQQKDDVPVFGSRAIVELGTDQEVVSASLDVVELGEVNTQPTKSSDEASSLLMQALEVGERGELPEPMIAILPNPEDEGKLHLVWHFKNVQFGPLEDEEDDHDDELDLGGCCAHGNMLMADFDYFVDAHSGELVYHYPNSAHLEIPTRCTGEDVDGEKQVFFGRLDGGDFKMENPFEDIRTFDLALSPIETTPKPSQVVENSTSDWQKTNPAAVSAHVNSTRVLDFLLRVLRRNSIDDNGMVLENIVNCASNQAPNPPEWINAVWWKGKMWFGQQLNGGGSYSSLSRHLDIIAHELFHGVTEHTAGLVYQGLQGALNESFSDIFGVIVNNWHRAPDAGNLQTWSWDIGTNLGAGGNPLRNMQNPSSVGRWARKNPVTGQREIVNGYPDHMSQYVKLPNTRRYDSGGVHWYSNIHNLAAYHVLTSQRPDNSYVFSPEEVAILYYLVLTRLDQLSDFDDVRAELLLVCGQVYAGSSARLNDVKLAISNAYDSVGII